MLRNNSLFPTGVFAVGLLLLLLQLILLSWILAAIDPTLAVRSLISADGVRWLFGSFTSAVGCPLLVWLLVCSMAYGAIIRSGVSQALSALVMRKPLDYRSSSALAGAGLLFILMLAGLCLLALLPHAVLLGVTGRLFPGPLADGLVPALALIVLLPSLLYGMLSGRFTSIASAYASLTFGLRKIVNILPLYVLATVFYQSVRFVFG